MEQYVKVSVKQMRELMTASNILSALQNGGVDNWEWYGESIGDFEKEQGDIETTDEEVLEQYELIA